MRKLALFTIVALLLLVTSSVSLAFEEVNCFEEWHIDLENDVVATSVQYGDMQSIAIANRVTRTLYVFDTESGVATRVDGLGQVPVRLAYDGETIGVTFDTGEVYEYFSWAPEMVSRRVIAEFPGECPEVYFDADGNLMADLGNS